MAALEITDLSWPDGSVALIVTGVVADDTAGAFGRALDSAIGIGIRPPLIDLTDCQLDSPGLAALIRLQHRSSSQRGATPLVAPNPDARLRRVVVLTTRCFASTRRSMPPCSQPARSFEPAKVARPLDFHLRCSEWEWFRAATVDPPRRPSSNGRASPNGGLPDRRTPPRPALPRMRWCRRGNIVLASAERPTLPRIPDLITVAFARAQWSRSPSRAPVSA